MKGGYRFGYLNFYKMFPEHFDRNVRLCLRKQLKMNIVLLPQLGNTGGKVIEELNQLNNVQVVQPLNLVF